MTLKKYNPTTNGMRSRIRVYDDRASTTNDPLKSATSPKSSSGGRNNKGRTTMRFRGGGHKRRYRAIDFARNKFDIPGKVENIEYDPNRSAYLARILYPDGERRYILAPAGIQVGDKVVSGTDIEMNVGNATVLAKIPTGTMIHNVEIYPGAGGQMVRSAGSSAQLMAKENGYAMLKMPSGEVRKILLNCRATIGQVGNTEHNATSYAKAGRIRWLGWRPHNRGVTMNPVDHPHGGGEGRTSGGRHPVTPWCQPTKGYKTRRNKRTAKFILKRRK